MNGQFPPGQDLRFGMFSIKLADRCGAYFIPQNSCLYSPVLSGSQLILLIFAFDNYMVCQKPTLHRSTDAKKKWNVQFSVWRRVLSAAHTQHTPSHRKLDISLFLGIFTSVASWHLAEKILVKWPTLTALTGYQTKLGYKGNYFGG